MIKQKIQDEINSQINAEMFSAYLYQSMSAYCEGKNLKGFANWAAIQAKEEMTHAMKFYSYLIERGGKVILQAIEAPQTDWENVAKMAEEIYTHEIYITGRINNLLCLATEEKDYATANMLQWFVAEQVEEESNADEIVQQLKMIEGKGAGLFMIDKELATRVFVDSTQV